MKASATISERLPANVLVPASAACQCARLARSYIAIAGRNAHQRGALWINGWLAAITQ